MEKSLLNKSEKGCCAFFKKFVKSVPMATCGLALAIATLGNLLASPLSNGALWGTIPNVNIIRNILGGLSFAVLLVFALKLLFDFPHAREELKTPVPASVLPTATMALMLLSTYLKPYMPDTAAAIWYTSVITHVCLMVFFFRRYIASFKLGSVFPSWFIPYVGIVVASVTAPMMGAAYIGQAAFYVGFIFYFITLALVVIRMNKVKIFPEPARPTLAIFAAPMSLLVVGYFQSFSVLQNLETANKKFIYFMLIIAAITYIYVLAMTIPIMRKKFHQSYTAFTFPLAISGLAFRMGAHFIVAINSDLKFLLTVADVTVWIAILAVAYVLYRYIRYFIYWLKF